MFCFILSPGWLTQPSAIRLSITSSWKTSLTPSCPGSLPKGPNTFPNYLPFVSCLKRNIQRRKQNSSNFLIVVRTAIWFSCICHVIFWSHHNELVAKSGRHTKVIPYLVGIHKTHPHYRPLSEVQSSSSVTGMVVTVQTSFLRLCPSDQTSSSQQVSAQGSKIHSVPLEQGTRYHSRRSPTATVPMSCFHSARFPEKPVSWRGNSV